MVTERAEHQPGSGHTWNLTFPLDQVASVQAIAEQLNIKVDLNGEAGQQLALGPRDPQEETHRVITIPEGQAGLSLTISGPGDLSDFWARFRQEPRNTGIEDLQTGDATLDLTE